MGKIKYIAALIIAVACIGLQQGRADSVTYYLTQGTPGISGYTGPYATVAVNRTDSTNATITFTSLTANGKTYLFGATSSVAINVNASSWKLGAITGSNSGTGFTPGTTLTAGPGISTDLEFLIKQSIALPALATRRAVSVSP